MPELDENDLIVINDLISITKSIKEIYEKLAILEKNNELGTEKYFNLKKKLENYIKMNLILI